MSAKRGTDWPATVLVVDDEPDVLDGLRQIIQLKFPQVEVATARTGAEALAVIRSREVHVLVTDFRMPGMDGLQLIRALREQGNQLPCIMISAYATEAMAEDDRWRLKVSKIMRKPLPTEDFLGELRRALAEARDRAGV